MKVIPANLKKWHQYISTTQKLKIFIENFCLQYNVYWTWNNNNTQQREQYLQSTSLNDITQTSTENK